MLKKVAKTSCFTKITMVGKPPPRPPPLSVHKSHQVISECNSQEDLACFGKSSRYRVFFEKKSGLIKERESRGIGESRRRGN